MVADVAGERKRELIHADVVAESPTTGVVWYQEVFINTAATAVVSVGVGNGTSVTRTSIYQNAGQFTVGNPTASTGSVALTQINYQPTANIGGAILYDGRWYLVVQTLISLRSSPTAYNVFTGTTDEHRFEEASVADKSAAYSVTSEYTSNGVCITSSGPPIPVTPAYSEILPSANGQVTLDVNGQQSFIAHLGFSTCSGGGENVVPQALFQVTNTTATTTSTFTNMPLAAVVASLTIAPVSPPDHVEQCHVLNVLFYLADSVPNASSSSVLSRPLE